MNNQLSFLINNGNGGQNIRMFNMQTDQYNIKAGKVWKVRLMFSNLDAFVHRLINL